MTEKILGKITDAKYGRFKGHEENFGLWLEFKLGDGRITDSSTIYMININKSCRWEPLERLGAIAQSADFVDDTLNAAHRNWVNELPGTPVEVTVEDNLFRGFRILTEVI